MSRAISELHKFFEENLEITEGKIVATLYKPNARDKISVWNFIIELYSGDQLQNISKEMVYASDLSSEFYTKYHTITGQMGGKMKESNPVIINVGKNLGKINRTTVITQAITVCRKRYNDKLKANFSKVVVKFDLNNMFELDMWRFAPPAFSNIHENWDKITYPCYMQPKIDGTRLLAVHNPIIGGLGMFTRKRKLYESDQPFVKELDDWLIKYQNIYVDGEVGIRGESFQDIAGLARRKSNKESIYYNIFDIFVSYEPLMPYNERLQKLTEMFEDFQYIKFTPTYEKNNKSELDKQFEEFEKLGDEGAIIRLPNDIYGFSFYSEKRVKTVFKWKTYEDGEWPVVSFTKAEGNHEGAIIWICKHENEEFGVGFAKGALNIEERRIIYEFLVNNPDYFMENFYMQELIIMYQEVTKSGIPIRGGAKGFRDIEVQQKILDILRA